jgi:uncharacterized protein (DUF885 family)
MKRINEEMRELGHELFGTRDLGKILTRLRTDPKLHFETEESVEAFATQSLAAAKAKMPEYFGILPKADCVVTRVPAYEAPFTTIAYYEPPFPDGTKPGEYYINTTAPTTRPRYEARVLAHHEAIPGHHLQIAIAQELPEVPAFRRHGGRTVFVEGWALYTERLSDEMGLYTDDLDRMGVLSFDAWRAGRLVVDTGIHAMGWSRKQAVDYFLEHSALAANNIDNEVDRYISWPGQAVAYKIGQLEILRLREKAQAKLGDRFDIKAFHDTVLGAGAVSIGILRERVAVPSSCVQFRERRARPAPRVSRPCREWRAGGAVSARCGSMVTSGSSPPASVRFMSSSGGGRRIRFRSSWMSSPMRTVTGVGSMGWRCS